MILRKPYAFLIKNFKKINIILLIFTIFIYIRNMSAYGFVRDYVNTAVYNELIDSVSNYINVLSILPLFITIIISAILVYLLRYKNKPYFSYVFLLVANLYTLIVFFYTNHYFTYNTSVFDVAAARIVRDLLLISTLPYYVMMVILTVRSIGLDLKKFGFNEDKEIAEINEEDREEVEVEFNLNRDYYIRKVKRVFRNFKYFFLEHKISLTSIIIIVILVAGYNVYHYVYVDHKVYRMNETIDSNDYLLTVNNTYLTDKDFAGNIISKDEQYYVILDITVENSLKSSRSFDTEKFYLFVDNRYYLPTTKYNQSFVDIGNLYEKGEILKGNETENYLLVYEIDKPEKEANFLLAYQDLLSKDKKTIKIKIEIRDISTFKTKDSKKLNEEMTVPINLEEEKVFTFDEYIIADSMKYTYEKCYVLNCPIYEGTLTAPTNRTILRLRGDFNQDNVTSFIQFLQKYGKLTYQINGEEKIEDVTAYMDRSYRGKYIYINAPNEIKNASQINLLFTVRTYQYHYQIKGEE